MLRALREIEGGVKLSVNALGRLGRLRRPPIRESFLRQIYFTGVTAATGVVLRASVLGVLIIAITMDVLDADVDLAVKILLLLVFREVGPLAAAVVVILRTGTAISAEVAMMRISGQTRALRHLGINLYDYIVVPRVAGVMLATMVLTFYIQFLAVLGGLLFSPLIIDSTFMELSGRFFALFSPVDFMYSTIKSLLFGFTIAACCCYHGLNPPSLTQNAVPQVVTRAVTQSAMLMLGINAVFAYIVFGILFFGLVTAKV
ncbi:MAG: ABC transporter permease [Betaproteobacteria bacterium]|nr:ABC transporter permease [Betaproteobacteria bacterium]